MTVDEWPVDWAPDEDEEGPVDRRAVLVYGPEGSGTRVVASILMYGGCIGSSDHYQWWDDYPFAEEDELVVWRRSFPHGRQRGWPDVKSMVERLRRAGFAVQAVVTVREHHSIVKSQLTQGYVETVSEGRERLREAYARIFGGLQACVVPAVVVTYEGLVARPDEVQKWLAFVLDLPKVPVVEIRDGNEKYYETQRV